MKCDYCGAVMPDPPSAPSYTETYTELREEIGKLEYNHGVLTKEKKKVEDGLISCRASEEDYKKGRKKWRWIAIATNVLWFLMLVSGTT
ncbi:MAG: hypothetical protein OXF50_22590 [Caldilineaceae bacterium]|nr:hypothetical protein [Caldilineaceae bacterium]